VKTGVVRRELPLVVDPANGTTLRLSVYNALREAVSSGRLAPGERLPSTRDLARQLGVARGTVVAAFELLTSEGYLRSAPGSGTSVVETLPDIWFALDRAKETAKGEQRTAELSKRGVKLAKNPFSGLALAKAPLPFRPHTPAVERFPLQRWRQLVARHARRCSVAQLREVDPRGFRPLREVLAQHLRVYRGVRCEVEQVTIVPGIHCALDLSARLLLDPGDRVWFEDPGYFGARRVVEASGALVVPIEVDRDGLDVDRALTLSLPARLAYVTPAHQAPLGAMLSFERRLKLLDWAVREKAWIFEDDYDGEFRYEGRPLPALQSLDRGGVVIYAGTFSKTLFPGMRLGYVVVPPSLVDPFTSALSNTQRFQQLLPQAVLTDFIAEGGFTQHLRRMRAIYAERRACLLEEMASELGEAIEVVGGDSGFEIVAMLEGGLDDRDVCRRANEARMEPMPLSKYAIHPLRRGGLLLGFGAVSLGRTRKAVPELARIIETAMRSRNEPSILARTNGADRKPA
jgi:GntR family transcriptional regulator/MocR family aminotransferase